MASPMDVLPFPVKCRYPQCGKVLNDAIEVDEHITEDHLSAAVWGFAVDNMRRVEDDAEGGEVMAAELGLKALREHFTREADTPLTTMTKPLYQFILKQIDRVDGCRDWIVPEGGCGCSRCYDLRADLLELQKKVLG